MLAPVTHILPLTSIRRERTLPVSGKVVVRSGQKVSATDIIVEADLKPQHRLIDVGQGLGMPHDKADRYIQVRTRYQLSKGDLIAGPVGYTRRVVRAPEAGEVVLVANGQVLLKTPGEHILVKAGLPGEVTSLVSDRGAVVETTGALVQGVWGNGQVDFGLMNLLASRRDQKLTHDQLDISLRGSIIMAAHCEDGQVFAVAKELHIRGFILSSIPAMLIPVVKELRIPVILIEGFGERPMNKLAHKLLSTNDRREVAVNAEMRDAYIGNRPEVVIPLPSGSELVTSRDEVFFSPGQQVRIIRAPYAGIIGTLKEVKKIAGFPNGLQAPAAEVSLENNMQVLVPLTNLEIIA